MAGVLVTAPWTTILDDAGQPVPGALIETYLTGTSTPTTTWSDAAQTAAHPNPAVADSAGRITIYVQPGVLYKFIVRTAAGVLIRTTDPIAGVSSVDLVATSATADGRISADSTNPLGNTGGLSASSLYYVPFRGNRIALQVGGLWQVVTFATPGLSLGTDAANTVYDLFAYWSGSAVLLERLAWASSSARATALTQLNGVYVKFGDPTRRYLGTYRTAGVAGSLQDDPNIRAIWNVQNRVRRNLQITDDADSWTYTTPTYRQANANTANQIGVVVGLRETMLGLTLIALASNTTAGVATIVAIGEDNTTGPVNDVFGACLGMLEEASTIGLRYQVMAQLNRVPPIGYHFYTWLEYSSAVGTTTWYGDGGIPTLIRAGMSGWIET